MNLHLHQKVLRVELKAMSEAKHYGIYQYVDWGCVLLGRLDRDETSLEEALTVG
jgi:hypothetical protein